ncbi:MAG: LysR family transcriptional regulator [Betaproteobacteria bacterium]|nr:LysR family transcriptional regulator [Betaproteobacteria bacterium]
MISKTDSSGRAPPRAGDERAGTPEPRVTLEQWQALVAVVDAGSYAKASQALHKSQSTLTYAVQKLESLLGVKAFEIRGRRAVLTPTGRMLHRRARILLDEARGIEQAAKIVSAGWEPEIRIAADIVFPYDLLLEAFDRFGAESPHTRIELIESVLMGSSEALTERRADLAISGQVPQGHAFEALARLRLIPAAHPDHALHRLARPLTQRDLRSQRQLVVRESDARRATKPTLEAAQRWTVSHISTSITAATMGLGFGWYAEDRIRRELAAGTLKELPMRDGGERFIELYLVYADRDNAGPGTLRLAQIVRERTEEACSRRGTTGRTTRGGGGDRGQSV